MLLVHGYGNEAHIWDDFAHAVTSHYAVAALDLRGHGDSDWDPESRYAYENHVADLESVVDHLGYERFVLVAHSLGGRVGTLYGGRHPEKLAGFVIVDSAPEIEKRGALRIQLDVQENRDPSFERVSEYESYLLHAYPAAKPEAIKRMAKHSLKQRDDGRWILKMDTSFRGKGIAKLDPEQLEKQNDRLTEEMWDALGKIPCPTLVVRGAASDILSADVADRMVDEVLPSGTLAIVPQAGHSVMTDNPKGFADALCAFVLG